MAAALSNATSRTRCRVVNRPAISTDTRTFLPRQGAIRRSSFHRLPGTYRFRHASNISKAHRRKPARADLQIWPFHTREPAVHRVVIEVAQPDAGRGDGPSSR